MSRITKNTRDACCDSSLTKSGEHTEATFPDVEAVEAPFNIIPPSGGGNLGGTRNNAGRKSSGRKDYNWKSYKPLNKKELKNLKASNHDIKELFSKKLETKGCDGDKSIKLMRIMMF